MHDQCTLDDVRTALGFVHDVEVRDTWIEMGMAIKAEFGDTGFEVWDDWSQQADNYDPRAARSSWKSFKRSAGGIGIGTLFGKAKEGGYEVQRRELTPEEKQARARERAERERQRAEDIRREEAETRRTQREVAKLAQLVIADLKPTGSSRYLGEKRIKAHGVRFFRSPVLIVHREAGPVRVTDREEISDFFKLPEGERPKFHYFKKGFFALPLVDIEGRLWNLQVITPNGKKLFLRGGRKSGLFTWLGEPGPRMPLVLVEGFATGASVREATGCPVLVCFDTGNLWPVAAQIRERYPDLHLVFAADNDCDKPENPGVTKATEAAQAVGGSVWIPAEGEALEDVA